MENKDVVVSAEEKAEFDEFKRLKREKEEKAIRRQQREEYNQLVDDEIASSVEVLQELSEQMQNIKAKVFGNFSTILKMKEEVIQKKDNMGEQYTHSFTSSSGKYRIVLGNRTIDDYRDTVEEGIEMVKNYLKSLAKDEESAHLVETVMRLLSKNKKGVIQPSRVLQLRKLAEQMGDSNFIEGVQIIEESYQPRISKSFISAQERDETGTWMTIPLSMTEV